MKQAIRISILVAIILILSFILLTQIKTNTPTPSPTSDEATTSAATNGTESTDAQAVSQSEYIKLISPNGGETFKIGSAMPITWEVDNIPADTQLDVELVTINGDTVMFNDAGVCTNCVFETRGGIHFYPLTNGTGNATWTAGELYRGGFAEPGNNYIFKVTVSKTGYESEGDCPLGAFKGMCETLYEIDWSDAPFTLTE